MQRTPARPQVFRIVWHIFSQPQPSPRERGAAPLRGRDDELFLTVKCRALALFFRTVTALW